MRVFAPAILLVGPVILAPYFPSVLSVVPGLTQLSLAMTIVMAVAGLWLLENIVAQSGPAGRWGSKYLCLGLATLFAFDLFLHSDALLLRRFSPDLLLVRALVCIFVAPLLAISINRIKSWVRKGDASLNVSSASMVHGVVLIGSGLYLLVMAGIALFLREIGGQWGNSLQIAFLVGGLLLMVVAVGSGRFKSQTKVLIHKYFFTYKYDYREEWRRFTAMMSAHQPLTLGERIVHAIADIMDSPAGCLWVWQRHDDAFVPGAAWNYRGGRPAERADSPFVAFLLRTGWVVEVERLREGSEDYQGLVLPPWMAEHAELWLVIPLIHRGEVLAFLALDRARAPRRLDWEDRDLLKTVGIHAAGFLAEEMAAEALSDAQRMAEFNRRFAFVVHDIKNVVGQMSLILENAQRHGDNPDFRKDMLETVDNSVARMKLLLEQLSEKRREREIPLDPVDLRGVVAATAERWQMANSNVTAELPAAPLIALAIENSVTAVLDLLIDNALGAAGLTGSVVIRLHAENSRAILEVQDDGPGMDEEFVSKELFRPLRTTKSNGYGIGAYQTRHLIREMGGRLEVDTAPNRGTTMRISLPMAADPSGQSSTSS
jgi:putative PEP-CTERM system histidine kinase